MCAYVCMYVCVCVGAYMHMFLGRGARVCVCAVVCSVGVCLCDVCMLT